MNVRFHLSFDPTSKNWYLEAHNIRARTWFVTFEALWPAQLERLFHLGILKSEMERLNVFEINGGVSTWIGDIEVDVAVLSGAGFVLQSTLAALPRRLTGI